MVIQSYPESAQFKEYVKHCENHLQSGLQPCVQSEKTQL